MTPDDPHQVIPGSRSDIVTTNDAGPRPLPWSRKLLALVIAVLADAPPLCLWGESFPVLFDVAVAAALWLALGRSRLLVLALLLECIPGIGLAPTWSAYVVFGIILSRTSKNLGQTSIAPK